MKQKKVLFKAGILLLSLLLVPGMTACAAISSLMATPTSTPTLTPTATPTPLPTPTATPTPLPTPTPKFFAIRSADFDEGETCFEQNVEIEILSAKGNSLEFRVVSGSVTIKKGRIVIFCYEAKHTWIGTLTYAGYTFTSDKDNPLQFQVTKNQGYMYIKGKGSVKTPDGTVVELP